MVRETGPIPQMFMSSEPVREFEKRPKEMARVFIAQSKSVKEIKRDLESGKSPAELSFINLVFAQKSQDSKNPDQLLPVGGSKTGEDKRLSNSARRHMTEETHLRPISLESLGDMNYSIQDDQTGDTGGVKCSYYMAKVLPHDVPYSLNPQDDKIVRYHNIDLETYEHQVVPQGYLDYSENGEGKKLWLVDSLRTSNSAESEATYKLAEDNTAKAAEVQSGLLEKLKKQNSVISRNIVEHWLDLMNLSAKDKTDVMDLLKEAEVDWNNTFESVWKFAMERVFKGDEMAARESFLAAYDLSIFEEEAGTDYDVQSQSEAILRSTLALLESGYKLDNYLQIMKDNPKLKDLAEKIEKFINSLSDQADPKKPHEVMYNRGLAIDDVPDELVEEAFIDSFFGDKKYFDRDEFSGRFATMNTVINELLDEQIVRSKLAPMVSDSFNDRLLAQVGEVRDADLIDLIKLAWPGVSKEEKDRFKANPKVVDRQNRDVLKRVVFEARRKLALMLVLFEADGYYDETIKQGKGKIEKVWGQFLGGPTVPAFLSDERGEDGLIKDVKVSSKHPSDTKAQETLLRPFYVDKEDYILLSQNARTKGRASFYRKMIVRGSDDPSEIKDVFGRSLVVVPSQKVSLEKILERQSRVLETYDVDGKKIVPAEEYNDYAAVLKIIENLQKDPHVKILKYTPTNEPGTSFASSGAGGGAEICMAKFYIEYTDDSGIKSHEEVQIFMPTDAEHSGFYWEKFKHEDDEEYEYKRLMRPSDKRIHSFVETMNPTRIYDEPIKNVYDAASRKKKK